MSNQELSARVKHLAALVEQASGTSHERVAIIGALLLEWHGKAIDEHRIALADLRSEILNEANRQMAGHVDNRLRAFEATINVLERDIDRVKASIRQPLASRWTAFWDWLLLHDR